MAVVPMRDSTTDGLMFVRPIPQGSAPPDPGAFWTDEYGWLVPDTRLQDIADAWNAYRENGRTRYSEAMDNFVGVIMNVVEDNND